ncbi:MAG: YeeE/YedE family protein [Rhodomicrobium sp.]|nr:YeeE/YedE family protein [Rhodomicrobium sp.]
MDFVFIGLLMGFVFGWALEKSRVFEPGMIVGQMQLRNFIMLKVFLTAVATGMVIVTVFQTFGLAKLHIKELHVAGVILGGLLLGAGISLSGACPGTALAQVGAGYRDAWFTVLGGIAGALTYGYFEADIRGALLADGEGKLTFVDLTGLAFWQIAVPVVVVIIGVLWALEVARPWRKELGENCDGYFPEGREETQTYSGHISDTTKQAGI